MNELAKEKAERFIAYMVDSGNKSDPETIRQAILYGIKVGYDLFKEDIVKAAKEMSLNNNRPSSN